MWNTTKTVPTVGRKLWLFVILSHRDVWVDYVKDFSQGMDATVAFVDNEKQEVTVSFADHHGESGTASQVKVFDPPAAGVSVDEWLALLEGKEILDHGDQLIASWMPYQAAQHASQAEKQQAVNVSQPVDLTLIDGKDV